MRAVSSAGGCLTAVGGARGCVSHMGGCVEAVPDIRGHVEAVASIGIVPLDLPMCPVCCLGPGDGLTGSVRLLVSLWRPPRPSVSLLRTARLLGSLLRVAACP